MDLLQLFLAITSLTAVITVPQRFDNYKVYGIKVLNKDHLNILRTLEQNSYEYDFWNSPIVGRTTDIMVSPEKIEDFEKMMKNLNLEMDVKVSNLQEFVLNV